MNDLIKCNGDVEIIIEDINTGEKRVINKKNTILTSGKAALAKCLTNSIGTVFDFYFSSMLFGNSGNDGSGNALIVDVGRTGLFGPTLATKSVSTAIVNETTIVITAILTSSDANGYNIDEILLQLASSDAYSMITIAGGGFSKSSSVQITVNWTISFV